MKATAYCDGRGNCDTGACAVVMQLEKPLGSVEEQWAYVQRLGKVTNNVAEYEAVLLTMQEAKTLGITELTIFSDSKLIVNQLLGSFDVRNPLLRKFQEKCWREGKGFRRLEIDWVPRENVMISLADSLCRQAYQQDLPPQVLLQAGKVQRAWA